MTHATSQAHDELSAVVDPYIEMVLDLQDRIDDRQEIDAAETRTMLVQYLRDASAIVGNDLRWQQASYALIAWTDELLLQSQWSGRQWWNDQVLEVEFFGTRVAGERFFQHAQRALQTGARDVVQVYHVCVLLGFRGIYAHRDAESLRRQGLPETLTQWIAAARARLATGRSEMVPVAPRRRVAGAEPIDLRRRIVWWSIAAAGLLTMNLTVYRLTH